MIVLRACETARFVYDARLRFSDLSTPHRSATSARWLRTSMERLGPVYVKLGQLLASRPDLLDMETISELTRLQDRVEDRGTSMRIDDILSRRRRGCVVKDRFASVDPVPLASASIGVVYRGRLRTGDDVVIKVLRPEARATVYRDLRLMRCVVRAMELFGAPNSDDASSLLDDLGNSVMKETDLIEEARVARKFHERYSSSFSVPRLGGQRRISIPRVYPDMCFDDLMVMEYVGSRRLTGSSCVALDMGSEDRRTLAHDLMHAYLTQLLCDHMMHGDTNGGNVGLTDDGSLVLYDFGSVIELDVSTASALKHLLLELVIGNVSGAADVLLDSGLVQTQYDRVGLLRYLEAYTSYLRSMDVDALSPLLSTSSDGSHRMPFRFSPIVVRIMRAFTMLEGMCRDVSPDFRYTDMGSTFFDILLQGDADVFARKMSSDLMTVARRLRV